VVRVAGDGVAGVDHGREVPPAVWPPVEEENSVRATAPEGSRRTSPAVSATARSLRASSTRALLTPAPL
jgi:hypothetical protein